MFIYSLEFHTGEKKMSQLATQGFINVKKILKGSLDLMVCITFTFSENSDYRQEHCWALTTNFLYSKVCWQKPLMFCLYTFPAHDLNFHWRWMWWDQIRAVFYFFYFYILFKKRIRSEQCFGDGVKEWKRAPRLILFKKFDFFKDWTKNKWDFVTKIVLIYCEKKNCSTDRENLVTFETEVREFEKFLRSLQQFIQGVKGQNNFV